MAKVVGVTSQDDIVDRGVYDRETKFIREKLLTSKGIDTGPIYSLLHCQLLDGMQEGIDGAVTRKFSDQGKRKKEK
jgi:hypothetical protein